MLLIALTAPSLGATLTVGPAKTYPTIGAAVTAAVSGDTLLIEPGTYIEAVTFTKSLTLQGNAGVFNMVGTGPLINANGTPTVTIRDAHLDPVTGPGIDTDGGLMTLERVTVVDARITVGNGAAVHASGGTLAIIDSTFDGNTAIDEQGGHLYAADTIVTVRGSTFNAGVAEKGGAIWMLRGSLTATNTTFTANRANTGTETGRGGAIRAQDATLTITGCTFDDNAVVGGYGGHISTFDGALTITDSTFTNGVADGDYGGALALYQSTAAITGSTFRNNRALADTSLANGHGGAVMVYGPVPGSLTIDDTLFDDNSADGYGGAIRVESGPATITNSTFTANHANYGAALHAMAKSPLVIDGSSFTDNVATTAGGAIRWRPDDATIPFDLSDSTFIGNTAGGPGGAVYATAGGALTVTDVAFTDNTAFPGGGLAINSLTGTDVLRSTFCGNRSEGTTNAYGGAVYAWQTGATRFANSAFIDSYASLWGGALYVQESAGSAVENSAFLMNDAGTGGAVGWVSTIGTFRNNIVLGSTGDGVVGGTGASATFSFDVFTDNTAAPVSGTFDAKALSNTNLLDVDPGFQAWSDDGDCTNDVLKLVPTSPLVDKGDALVLDPDGGRSDIGPYGGPGADPDAWGDADSDGSADMFDCAPTDPDISPLDVDVAYDGVDQDCSGADLTDVDGDGYAGKDGGGQDCEDDDPTVNPGKAEVAYDGLDQNCDGKDLVDVDQDGYDGEDAGGDDCDDGHASINPGMTDVPGNFVDEDCTGADADGDGSIDDTDDTTTPVKTCNCGTSDPRGAGLLAAAVSWLLVRRRRAQRP